MSKHRDGFFKLGGNNNKNDTEKSVPSIDIDIKEYFQAVQYSS